MPVLIPIVAAGAAYFGASMAVGAMVTAGMVAAGSVAAVVAGAVVGAVIGAAVGAVGAAVTGGDIGKGALWGAIGGMVAGGFAGWSAAGAAKTAAETASSNALNMSNASDATRLAAAEKVISSPKPVAGSGLGDAGKAALIETGGQAVMGYAQGEAAEEAAAEEAAAALKARDDAFKDQMAVIAANHKNRMEQIGAQGGGTDQMALAKLNNDATMDQLNTRIGADKDAAQGLIADRENEQNQLNDSILGTDANLFDRPTFNFNPAENTAAFDSGFDEAASQSPNAQLTPEEQLALQQATA